MSSLLFLCTGNYYRSRFAEIYFNWHAERAGVAWRATSRGLALEPSNVGPMSRYTLARLAEHGIPCDAHLRLPQDVSEADFAAARHVVAVKAAEHQPLIARRFPHWLERVEFWHVHDIDCAAPQQAIPQLERQVLDLLGRLRTPEAQG